MSLPDQTDSIRSISLGTSSPTALPGMGNPKASHPRRPPRFLDETAAARTEATRVIEAQKTAEFSVPDPHRISTR